jgi:thymidine phosphorylase
MIRDFGAGRLTKGTIIQPEIGVNRLVKPGERVESGGVLARIHANDTDAAEAMQARLAGAFAVADAPPPAAPLIVEAIGG